MKGLALYGPKLFLVILIAVVASTLLGQLDTILASMHLEEDPSYDVGTLTGGAVMPGRPSDVPKAVRTWTLWDCGEVQTEQDCRALRDQRGGLDRPSSSTEERTHASPKGVVALALMIDLLFIAAYGLLLVALTVAAGNRGFLTRRSTGNWLRVVLIVVVADILENLLLFLAILSSDPARPSPSPVTTALSWAVWVAGRAKWWPALALILVLMYAFLGPDEWGWPSARLFRTFKLLKVSSITFVLVLLVLSGPLFAPQIADAIRRWSVLHAAVTSVFALALAFYVWYTARDPITRVREGLPRPAKNTTLMKRTGTLLLVVGALRLAAAPFAGLEAYRGLVVPAVIVVLLTFAGWLLKKDEPVVEPKGTLKNRYLTSARIPRGLGAAVLGVVGLVVLKSAFIELVFNSRRELSVAPVIVGVVLAGLLIRLGFRLSVRRADPGSPARTTPISYAIIAILLVLTVTLFLSGQPKIDRGLASLWIVVIGLILVVASMPFYFFLRDVDDERVRAVMGISVETKPRAAAESVYVSPLRIVWDNLRTDPRFQLAVTPSLIALIFALWIYLQPVRAPQVLGATGVVLMAVTLIALVLGSLSWIGEHSTVPRLLQRLRFRRVPLFLGIVMWGIVMVTVWKEAGFHDVQILGRSSGNTEPLESNLGTADMLSGWEKRGDAANAGAVDKGVATPEVGQAVPILKPARPMVFISAWGGGIRAGVWTALAVDCAFNPEEASPGCPDVERSAVGSGSPGFDAVAAASGISGGSVGLANYVANSLDPDGGDWVRRRLGGDYVAPDLARLVLTDIPLTFLGGSASIRDRVDVMQEAWEDSWEGTGGIRQGINQVWKGGFDELPLVVMNSASLNDACAINVSPAQLGVEIDKGSPGDLVDECRSLAPFDKSRTQSERADIAGKTVGTRDVNDYLCAGEDISLAAGSLMSARFPAVSPSGRLEAGSCIIKDKKFDRDAEGYPDLHSTDGGQLEPSATLTATQLWLAVEDRVEQHNAGPAGYCIAPVLIHLENGFSSDIGQSDSGIPNEWFDPLVFSGVKRADGLIANIRQRAAFEFSKPLGDGLQLVGADGKAVGRFAFVRTKANPGPSAPLGWTLSRSTFNDLDDQLQRNAGQYDLIDRWLRQPLYCRAPGARVEVPMSPDQAFAAFSGRTAEWWTPGLLDAGDGGIRFQAAAAGSPLLESSPTSGEVQIGEVTASEPGKRIAFTAFGSLIEVSFEPAGDASTEVTVTPPSDDPAGNEGWVRLLNSFAEVAR